MSALKIIEVTPGNVQTETLFCVKDITKTGFENKRKWFEKRYERGLRLKILKGVDDKMISFIESVPAEYAWLPIDANNFMFIHCMYVYSKKDRNKGYGTLLVNEVEKEALAKGMDGVCAMTSEGAWVANEEVFLKNEYRRVAQKGRFELVSKKWNARARDPQLMNWTAQQKKYQGWHLVYADQCPWHEKSVEALLNEASDHGIELQVKKLKTAKEAKHAPSDYEVFNLLHGGKLLEDHYLSATRFRTILEKEGAIAEQIGK